MARHTVVLGAAGDDTARSLDLDHGDASTWVPIAAPTARVVEERLPPGAAAALLNTAHTDTDLVLFVSRRELRQFREIDGTRTVAHLGTDAKPLLRRLWRHDLIVFDTTGGGPT